MQNDERVRPVFLGIAANGALRWNEAKGRVTGGNFYVMTPQGEQGMDLAGSQVEFVDLEKVDGGPEFCFALHLPRGVSLPMGVFSEFERETWVEALQQGIALSAQGKEEAGVQGGAPTSGTNPTGGNPQPQEEVAELEVFEDSDDDDDQEEVGLDNRGMTAAAAAASANAAAAGSAVPVNPGSGNSYEGTEEEVVSTPPPLPSRRDYDEGDEVRSTAAASKPAAPLKASAKEVGGSGAAGAGAKKPLPPQLEADEAGVIGVVCEAVERAVEQDAATEGDAVAIVRQHLEANEEGSLDRALALWCERFQVDMPQNPSAEPLTVMAKWIFWMVQARTLLRARFEANAKAGSGGKGGGSGPGGGGDPLEDMVLGQWAGELGLTLPDLAALHSDPATRDDLTRDLAFWFHGKAQDEAFANQGGIGPPPPRRDSVVRRNNHNEFGNNGSSRPSLKLTQAAAAQRIQAAAAAAPGKTGLVLRAAAREQQQQESKKPGGGGASADKTKRSGGGGGSGGIQGAPPTPGRPAFEVPPPPSNASKNLQALEELPPSQRAAVFASLAPFDKADVLLDLTPLERKPLLAMLSVSDLVELLAIDDVVLALSADELLAAGIGSTSLQQRALALASLDREAKFKLFALEGRAEFLEIEDAKRATLGHRDGAGRGPPSAQAIGVAIASRVALYHLLDHRSRIVVVSHFADRRERTDLLLALSSENRQELIDACVTAEMAGNREWFNGWDWFDWFDFSPNPDYDDDDEDEEEKAAAGSPEVQAAALERVRALNAYASLIGPEAAVAATTDLLTGQSSSHSQSKRKVVEENEDGSLPVEMATANKEAAAAAAAQAKTSRNSVSVATGNTAVDAMLNEGWTQGLDGVSAVVKAARGSLFGDDEVAAAAAAARAQAEHDAAATTTAASASSSKAKASGGSNEEANPAAIFQHDKAEYDRLARRDQQLRDLEDGLRRVTKGDTQLAGLLDAWRAHKAAEKAAQDKIAGVQRRQQQAQANLKLRQAQQQGRKPTAADQLAETQRQEGEAADVRSLAALEAERDSSAAAAKSAEMAMAESRKLLLPSAHSRSDLALLAQRVSVSYFSEVEFVKTQMQLEAGRAAMQAAQAAKQGGSGGDVGTPKESAETEDVKLQVFTLELENARLVSECAALRRSLVEQARDQGPGAYGNSASSLHDTSAGSAAAASSVEGQDSPPGAQPGSRNSSEVGRLRAELVSTRLQVAVLSESLGKMQNSATTAEVRARQAEDEAARRRQEFESSGSDLIALRKDHAAATKELAWVRGTLDGCIAAKDRTDAKLAACEAQLATVAQLDPHRWHAGRQNVRLETELRAARDDRDRSVARANKDVAHFKAEISLAADKLSRAEAQLSAAVAAAQSASDANEGEVADLEQRLLAMQALLDTANGRLDAQSASYDALQRSHAVLEAGSRAGAEKLALYEKRATLADESLSDARAQLVALTKTHELMKSAETRRVQAFAAEKAQLEKTLQESLDKSDGLATQLAAAQSAGATVSSGLEEAQGRVQVLEGDMATLLAQEGEMRAALGETKAVLLKVTADYKQRMGEAALVARELKAAEQTMQQSQRDLAAERAAVAALKEQVAAVTARADRSASAGLALQRNLATREEEVATRAAALMALATSLEPGLSAAAATGGSEEANQVQRVVDLQRQVAELTESRVKSLGGKASASEGSGKGSGSNGAAGDNVGGENSAEGEGGGGLGDFEALASELEAARAAQAVLDGLADQHAASVDFSGDSGDIGDAGQGQLFDDTVLMSETERILGLIDNVEQQSTSRPASQARP